VNRKFTRKRDWRTGKAVAPVRRRLHLPRQERKTTKRVNVGTPGLRTMAAVQRRRTLHARRRRMGLIYNEVALCFTFPCLKLTGILMLCRTNERAAVDCCCNLASASPSSHARRAPANAFSGAGGKRNTMINDIEYSVRLANTKGKGGGRCQKLGLGG